MTTNEVLDALERIKADADRVITALTFLDNVAKAEPAKAKTKITLEDVRAALTKLASVKGATHVKALLADHHAKKLSDLAPASYAVVLLAAEKELGSE